jgi:hypothetical protein
MPFAWYLCPYSRRTWRQLNDSRYCAIDDFSSAIEADGGAWAETEVLGDNAIVKVRASLATLLLLNAASGFTRLPKDTLLSPLSDLTALQKLGLRNKILALGYTSQEIQTRFGSDLGSSTLLDVLRFIASRRIESRYDADSQSIVFDGAEVTPRSPDELDEAVR